MTKRKKIDDRDLPQLYVFFYLKEPIQSIKKKKKEKKTNYGLGESTRKPHTQQKTNVSSPYGAPATQQ